MLLEDLRSHADLDSAARAMAGNYLKWQHFAVIHRTDEEERNAKQVMLGYTINHTQYSPEDEANHLMILKVLNRWMQGDNPLVCELRSSVSGDKDVLIGFDVRVYENGEITQPFRLLYKMAMITKDRVLNKKKHKLVARRIVLRTVHCDLPQVCKDRGVPYDERLIVPLTDIIMEHLDEDLNDAMRVGDDEVELALCDYRGDIKFTGFAWDRYYKDSEPQ